MKKPTNIVLIGLGKHSMRTYWSFLELLQDHSSFSVVALVDLVSSKGTIDGFIEKSRVKPKEIILLENKSGKSCRQAVAQLNMLHEKEGVDKVVIATEPCSHSAYIDWAISCNIDTLVEKPITAVVNINRDKDHAKKIERYVTEIAAKDIHEKISVQTQRRYNTAYAFAYSYVKDFVKEFSVPISFLSVHQEDGLWNSVNEFLTEEAHPYKYGYGKLMHSGYHYIDLFCWFAHLNELLEGKKWADEMSLATEVFRPIDLANQLHNFSHLSEPYVQSGVDIPETLGEIDCYNSVQFKKNSLAVLTGRIDMVQNSVSSRSHFSDTYAGKHQAGACKYEETSIYVGPLLKLKIFTVSERSANAWEYHFKVEIQRNATLVGGKEFDVLDFKLECGTVYNPTRPWTPNQAARFVLFGAFLSGRENISKIKTHVESNRLLSLMYQNIVAAHNGELPYSKISL
ncbi:MAG: Gfo/Idh/MocA family oxidoreductase [Myxococcota bacterium]